MSPEYRVDVSPEQAEEFEAWAQATEGVYIINRIASRPADHKEDLEEYLARFAQRINRLSSPALEVETGLWAGYRELLRAAAAVSHNEDKGEKAVARPLLPEEMRTAVSNLNDIFLECTRVDPEGIRQGRINYTHWPRSILAPREIDMLIIKFGLEDGNQRSYADLAAIVNLSPGYCRVRIDRALRHGFSKHSGSKVRENYRRIQPFVEVVELTDEEKEAWKKKKESYWKRSQKRLEKRLEKRRASNMPGNETLSAKDSEDIF